jgi:hypothetical protein
MHIHVGADQLDDRERDPRIGCQSPHGRTRFLVGQNRIYDQRGAEP